ncbi:hypothetical protein, partial [Chromohalobacter japonicus]
ALTEGLEELSTAQDNLSSFLEGAADNEAVAAAVAVEDPDQDQLDTALDSALGTTETAVDDELQTFNGIADGDFEAAGKNTKQGLIEDGRETAQENIDTAQTNLDDYQAEIAKVDGLSSAIATAKSAAEELTTAQAAQTEALDAYAGAEVTFEASNEVEDGLTNAADVVLQKDDGAGGYSEWVPGTDDLSDLVRVQDDSANAQTLFTVNDDGELVAESGLDAYAGLDALQSSIQSVIDATAEVEAATTANGEAVTALEDFAFDDDDFDGADLGLSAGQDGTDVLATLQGNETTLEDAQEAQQDLNDAVSAWQGVVELDEQRTELEGVVTEAQEAIEGEDGLNIDLREDGANFSTEDEVYLFNADDGAQTLSGFGASGEDKIYVGDSFTQVNLAEDADFADEQGDAATLEVFFQQEGNDTVLSFEDKAFAGNASVTDDMTQVTLTGVNAEDLSLDNGYISVA